MFRSFSGLVCFLVVSFSVFAEQGQGARPNDRHTNWTLRIGAFADHSFHKATYEAGELVEIPNERESSRVNRTIGLDYQFYPGMEIQLSRTDGVSLDTFRLNGTSDMKTIWIDYYTMAASARVWQVQSNASLHIVGGVNMFDMDGEYLVWDSELSDRTVRSKEEFSEYGTMLGVEYRYKFGGGKRKELRLARKFHSFLDMTVTSVELAFLF